MQIFQSLDGTECFGFKKINATFHSEIVKATFEGLQSASVLVRSFDTMHGKQ